MNFTLVSSDDMSFDIPDNISKEMKSISQLFSGLPDCLVPISAPPTLTGMPVRIPISAVDLKRVIFYCTHLLTPKTSLSEVKRLLVPSLIDLAKVYVLDNNVR
jgi:hypothetical protein